MVFSSAIFLFLFLPFVLVIYFFLSPSLKNTFLLISSLFFYFCGEPVFILVMFFYIVMNYIFGIVMSSYESLKKRKLILIFAVISNLGLLVLFKYFNFIIANVNALFNIVHFKPLAFNPIHLPLGISFIAFHSISYIVDIYRKKSEVQKSIINFALYISLFPQLIAGPIIRYHNIASQLTKRTVGREDFIIGIKRFIVGLAKKMLIANTLGKVADQIFLIPADQLSFSISWLGIICYTLQIYFDFSGYSDMAIGLCQMFGFRILENFNYPYISLSIREFWTRWHISLSNWFRDYLYIPLGGNRCRVRRNYFNLLVVFFLCGLWHGASWTFVVWGIYHGAFLIIERTKLFDFMKNQSLLLQHSYTMFVVMVGWVFFRADTLSFSISYVGAMLGFGQGDNHIYHTSLYLNSAVTLAILIGILAAIPLKSFFNEKINYITNNKSSLLLVYSPMKFIFLTAIYILSIMQLAIGTYNPFIYFRF